jgi:purine-nucleoside phosphorylase
MTPSRPHLVTSCAEAILASTGGVKPKYGMVLGSGLGPLADAIDPITVIDYSQLPGFPTPGVEGHAGKLTVGRMGETIVAAMQGRAHYYEHGDPSVMAVPVACLRAIGCETLILTNAAGSLDLGIGPGSAMLITDHINLTGTSPLFGEVGNARFVNMSDAYDPAICDALRAAARAVGETLHEGIYCWFSGPQFETPAEIRMARTIGGSAVGMSTVPEVILARHAGMTTVALSNITNLAAGLSDEVLSHEHTQAMAAEGAARIGRILTEFLGAG